MTATAIKVGLFALANAALAAWLVVTIGNIALFEDRSTYEAVFDDVTGLLPNDAVKISGVAVGKVEGIDVERGNAIVRFSVREDIGLGRDTTVGVRIRNLLGLRYLYVYPEGSGTLEAGYRFPNDATRPPADFGLVLERFTPIVRSLEPNAANKFNAALIQALEGREQQVKDLIAEAATVTQAVASRDTEIAELLSDAERLAGAYAARQQDLRDLVSNFSDVATTLADRNDEVIRVVTELGDGLAEVDRFLRANRGEVDAAVEALEDITTVLAVNHENLEDIVTYLGRGLVAYHRISRWGQWFNIRVVGVSASNEETPLTERGASLPPKDRETSGSSAASFRGFLRLGEAGVHG